MINKTALVTGSSRGIGAAIAQQLACDGWNVILHYSSNQGEAEKVAREMGPRCLGLIRANLNEEEATTNLWLEAKELGDIHCLVNNAGIYVQSPFSQNYEYWKVLRTQMMRVNFEAPSDLLGTQRFRKDGFRKSSQCSKSCWFSGGG
jgi:NAD(P)-dependent dehydrogenase (short-subunit alcohol dehydrogenase family)